MTHVMKLAQQGYDVGSAGDANLIFSSLWPLLKIYQSGKFQVSDVTQQQVIANHDLNFPAMFWYFTNNNINAWLNLGAQSSDNRSEFFGSPGNGSIGINNNQLVFTPGLGTTGSLQGYYYIFATDLTKQYTAPITNAGGSPANVSSSRSFKIAKPGQNVKSHRLKDYVIHSDTRSPLIHSVNPGIANDATFTVYHNLGYNPMFFGYTLDSGLYKNLYTGSGGTVKFVTDNTKISFQDLTPGRTLSVVVLKDPFLINSSVSVVH